MKTNFKNIIAYLVSKVRDSYDTGNVKTFPRFLYGTQKDISDQLLQMDEAGIVEFPAIFLMTPYKEYSAGSDYQYQADFILFIVASTDENFSNDEKYDNVINPVITPIYELLLEAMEFEEGVEIRDIDNQAPESYTHLDWGKKGVYGYDGWLTDNYVDAMQLNFKAIKVDLITECHGLPQRENYSGMIKNSPPISGVAKSDTKTNIVVGNTLTDSIVRMLYTFKNASNDTIVESGSITLSNVNNTKAGRVTSITNQNLEVKIEKEINGYDIMLIIDDTYKPAGDDINYTLNVQRELL